MEISADERINWEKEIFMGITTNYVGLQRCIIKANASSSDIGNVL
jgi:hypothetical protein